MLAPNIHREAAYSIVQSELSKVNKIRRKQTLPGLDVAVEVIADYLQNAVEEVEDAYDLKALRSKLGMIAFFLNTVERSFRDHATWWALPLIRECYEACGIDSQKRVITIVQANENESFSVIPNIIGILRRQIDIHAVEPEEETQNQSAKVWHQWDKVHPIIDIFTIPAEARYDISSIAMIGHEVGHIFWVIPEHRDFLARKIASFRGPILMDQLEELLSDEVARFLLGPAFDFSLIKLLVSMPVDLSGQQTHPAVEGRILNCLGSLRRYKAPNTAQLDAADYLDNEELNTCLDTLVSGLEKAAGKNPGDGPAPLPGSPTEILAAEIIGDDHFKHKRNSFNCSLLEIWQSVLPELDAMRPPFERVNREAPQAISPRQALIGVSIYYYSGAYAGTRNTYYNEVSKDHRSKTEVVRRTLVNHLKYAIGLHDFVKSSQNRFCEGVFFDNSWDPSLWRMRTRVVREIPASLVVVPSTHPRSQYGPHSIDLRLGNSFLINRLTKFAQVETGLLRGEEGADQSNARIKNFYDERYIPVGQEFVLHPHQFILAATLEYLCLPFDYYGLVLGRSSWGRLGLNIATATTVHAGFKGCLTLELRNLGETPLSLKVGLRIAQLTLVPVPEGAAHFVQQGEKYVGPVFAEVSKLHNDPDWEVLDQLKAPGYQPQVHQKPE